MSKTKPYDFSICDGAKSFTTSLQNVLRALHSEEPLPCVLICGAFIDRCLKGMLKKLFIDGATSEKLLEVLLRDATSCAKTLLLPWID